MVACGIFGIPVAKSLSAGGFQDPTSESAQATQLLVEKSDKGDRDLVIRGPAAGGAQGQQAREVGAAIAAQLALSAPVGGHTDHQIHVALIELETSSWVACADSDVGS